MYSTKEMNKVEWISQVKIKLRNSYLIEHFDTDEYESNGLVYSIDIKTSQFMERDNAFQDLLRDVRRMIPPQYRLELNVKFIL